MITSMVRVELYIGGSLILREAFERTKDVIKFMERIGKTTTLRVQIHLVQNCERVVETWEKDRFIAQQVFPENN